MFTQVHHVAFLVRDLDRWVDQYERVFGVEMVTRERLSGTFDLEVALFPAGETLVELITPTAETGWAADHLAAHGEGFFHVAFAVDDLRARMRELEARGVGLEFDEPKQGLDWELVTIDPAETVVTTQLVEEAE